MPCPGNVLREGARLTFTNVYGDPDRAASYARLEFPGTYYLAFRDLPGLLAEHVRGRKAVDFGCGAGRSTRFLRERGFDVVGVDVSGTMIAQARERDPAGAYVLIDDGDFSALGGQRHDLVLAAFTFDNIPGTTWRARLLAGLRDLLREQGRIVLLGSTPEIYTHEWESFSTRDFPENRSAGSGDRVRIVMTTVPDRRPVEDLLWRDEDYRALFKEAGLEIVVAHRPLAREDEPFGWVSETTVPPWVIYVLARAA